MVYPKNFHIVKFPLDFENTRERLKRRNIGFNFPILVVRASEMFSNIIEYHDAMKRNGFSGALMHYQIDENGLIYEARDTIYQNGFADRIDVDADDFVKNAILIQVHSDSTSVLSDNLDIYKSLKKLLLFLCKTEILCPITDIKDMGNFMCMSSPSFNSSDFFKLRKSIMNDMFPTKKLDWNFAETQQYSIIDVPDYEQNKRTITYISRVLAESMDYDKWNPVAENIIKANKDVINKLSKQGVKNSDILDTPLNPGTLLIAPPTKFIYFVKKIKKNAGIALGKQIITNTIANSIYQISEEVKSLK